MRDFSLAHFEGIEVVATSGTDSAKNKSKEEVSVKAGSSSIDSATEKPARHSDRVIQLETVPELSAEDIEDVLKEDDPEFLSQINEIALDKNLSITEISISLTDDALADERDRLLRSGGMIAILVKILPFVPRLTLSLKMAKRRLRDFLISMQIRLSNFIDWLKRDGKAIAKEKFLSTKKSYLDWLNGWKKFLSNLSALRKVLFAATVALTIGTGFFIYRAYKFGVITEGDSLFLTSFEKVAGQVYEYDPKTEMEPFFENLRGESNVLMVPKMVANLKKSKTSGNLPMGAFEFYLEGWASEAIIEFKDREVEFRDAMLRTIEEYTFDQLDSAEGKKDLCIRLEKVINSRLTSGQLKRVLLKTAIVKP